MKPLPLSPRRAPSALLSAALLALSAAARAQNVVHIEINAPSVVAGVQAVALPTMSLGAATPTLGQATLNAAPLPADVRVRGVAVPDAARERILAEKEPARLERWLERGIIASSITEVMDEPS